MTNPKPLNWKSTEGIGYSVVRRVDGGMTFTFTDMSDATIEHWRDFVLEHLSASDRSSCNLYDLRLVKDLPEKAVLSAIDVNSHTSAHNIRVAVVVNNLVVFEAIRKLYYRSHPDNSAEIKIFTDPEAAEMWLNRPIQPQD